jgi:hypothetical protein
LALSFCGNIAKREQCDSEINRHCGATYFPVTVHHSVPFALSGITGITHFISGSGV